MAAPVPDLPALVTRREFLGRATLAAGAFVAAGGVLRRDATASALSSRIVTVAVHPAIGIARVGNSTDSFYFGPELPGAPARAPAGFKDATGAIARQAARFRIYGYDAAGVAIAEITAAEASITWRVNVANTKAAWYTFDRAMDLPAAETVERRNGSVTGADRRRLVVNPGEKTISGPAAAPVALDGGRFLDEPVSLGELLTDELGRLVFVPGEGRGYAPGQASLTSFANNNGWTDDTCDGPVSATVTIDGRTLEAEPGWVVVTQPNYAPGVGAGVVTAYDSSRLGWDSFDAARLTPADVSFRDDILPILRRIVDMQWVNAGYLGSNGWGTDGDYLSGDSLARLGDPSAASAPARAAVFATFRNPDYATAQPDAEPRMYGDGVSFPARSPYQWLTVTPIQYALLASWAFGLFTDDRDQPPAADLSALSPAEQVLALDRAALDSCLGGTYHPGIDMPWTLRVPSMWRGPRRLRVRSTTLDHLDYGERLTAAATMAEGGPLAGSGPGDLTRWMAAPWHADAASCRSGREPNISTVLPTFWPARIPNHVLHAADYRIVVDTARPLADRQAAFGRRYDWQRFVAAPERRDALRNMAEQWAALGLVTAQPGPTDGAFPAVLLVESDVGFPTEPASTWNAAFDEIDPVVWDSGPVTTQS